MNNIVRLTTQDIQTALPVTDSLIISEWTKTSHKNVIQLIEKHFATLEEFGQVEFEMRLISHNKRTQEGRVYLLNEQQSTLLLTMSRNTPEVLAFKVKLVKAFFAMAKELQARHTTRRIGVGFRKSLTDSIKANVQDEGKFKSFAYSNYSKLVYKKILGKDVKKIKQERNIPESGNLRDYLTAKEIEKVQDMESKIALILQLSDTLGKTDKEIYEMIKDKV